MQIVQLTSISVSTKGEKQAGTIQLSKYVLYTRWAQSLHKLYSPKLQILQMTSIDILAFQNFI